jgi:hypothetical protein
MEIPKYTGDEDKDEIIYMEWLRLVKESSINPSMESNYFLVKLDNGG